MGPRHPADPRGDGQHLRAAAGWGWHGGGPRSRAHPVLDLPGGRHRRARFPLRHPDGNPRGCLRRLRRWWEEAPQDGLQPAGPRAAPRQRQRPHGDRSEPPRVRTPPRRIPHHPQRPADGRVLGDGCVGGGGPRQQGLGGGEGAAPRWPDGRGGRGRGGDRWGAGGQGWCGRRRVAGCCSSRGGCCGIRRPQGAHPLRPGDPPCCRPDEARHRAQRQAVRDGSRGGGGCRDSADPGDEPGQRGGELRKSDHGVHRPLRRCTQGGGHQGHHGGPHQDHHASGGNRCSQGEGGAHRHRREPAEGDRGHPGECGGRAERLGGGSGQRQASPSGSRQGRLPDPGQPAWVRQPCGSSSLGGASGVGTRCPRDRPVQPARGGAPVGGQAPGEGGRSRREAHHRARGRWHHVHRGPPRCARVQPGYPDQAGPGHPPVPRWGDVPWGTPGRRAGGSSPIGHGEVEQDSGGGHPRPEIP